MALPSGTVTFLFSDIEGSTRLARSMSTDDWAALVMLHDELADDAVGANRGVVVKHEGDGMFAAFAGPTDAVDAAVALSRAVATRDWRGAQVRLRIGIHTGAGQLTHDGRDYVGVDIAPAGPDPIGNQFNLKCFYSPESMALFGESLLSLIHI